MAEYPAFGAFVLMKKHSLTWFLLSGILSDHMIAFC